jgi:hypothetical protein
MDILPSKLPNPRLLSSVSSFAPHPTPASDPNASADGVFSGATPRWVVLLLACALVAGGGYLFRGHYLKYRDQREVRMLQVETHRLAAAPHSNETPSPVTIQYGPEMLRVSAIALGHPRLAVINGRALTEGDEVVLHTPTRNVAVSLRVMRIADGHVDLSDGTQTITANLVVPPLKKL